MNGLAKPSRTERRAAERRAKRDRRKEDNEEYAKVRRRDGNRCRFPLCGCGREGMRAEVSHDCHKGMGSKDGVTVAPLMITLCSHRHQHASISRHLRTLRNVYLTPEQNNGPVAWVVDLDTLERKIGTLACVEARRHVSEDGCVEIARESSPQVLEPLEEWQRYILKRLAAMEF